MARPAKRIEKIPPYLFARIDKKKEEARKKGIDLIDLSIGDPDIPTPQRIVDAMKRALDDPSNHRYPSYEGMYEFREAAARWCERRFGIPLDPATEIVALIGSKEGIAHIPWAYVDRGDCVLVPSPGYPVYSIATLLAGGTPYFMPLKEENDFLPELDLIPDDVMRQVKLIFINYPNNPTAGCAKDEFFEKVIYYAKRYEILVCHDAAYSEVTFDGYKPKSIIEFDKEKRYSIEFHSLSKTYCMTGWRIGFAIGNKDGINNLGKLKTNIDSGVFQAIQIAGIEAMMGDQSEISEMNDRLKKRRDLIVDGLIDIGIAVKRPKATYYIWAKVPEGYTSSDFCERLIEETGVVVTPGIGFGDYGEGYFRISITTKEERIREAIKRLKDVCAK